jgi:hypothetical protein
MFYTLVINGYKVTGIAESVEVEKGMLTVTNGNETSHIVAVSDVDRFFAVS